jgi:hypothetical protein
MLAQWIEIKGLWNVRWSQICTLMAHYSFRHPCSQMRSTLFWRLHLGGDLWSCPGTPAYVDSLDLPNGEFSPPTSGKVLMWTLWIYPMESFPLLLLERSFSCAVLPGLWTLGLDRWWDSGRTLSNHHSWCPWLFFSAHSTQNICSDYWSNDLRVGIRQSWP